MKKIVFLFPLFLSACFPVVVPVTNPMDEAPNIYGAWRLNDVGGFSPNDPNAVFTVNNSDDGFSVISECAKVSGRYSIGENYALMFNQMRADNRCEENVAERRLPQELGNVRSYRFNSRHLELLNEEGRVILLGKRFRNEKSAGPSTSGETLYLLDARRH
ncbi:META domain-containing protein [Neisseria sp. CCUG12390]|uniref:META domain-containing protein n=1 Tax=Neisseria sp. CCUG12390 TaxID=3392035 RepID=UPI003A0FC85A